MNGSGSNNKIIDLKGQGIAPVVVGDDKYEGLDAVLLDGKTLATISAPQLVYLRSVVDQATVDYKLVLGEWAYRIGRQASDPLIPQPEEEK